MNLGDATLTGSTKDMLHAMVEFGRDIITLFDGKGCVVFSSSSHRSILGYDAIDIFTTKAIELIHPEDRDTIINNFYELLTHPSVRFNCHWRQQHSDGHYIWMEGTGINKLDDPNIKAIICNYRDISEQVAAKHQLEQANKELTNVFNNIDEVIFSAKTNPYQLTQCSDACYKVYGYAAEEFLQNPNLWHEVILPEDKHIIEDLIDMLRTGNVSTVPYRIRHRNGRICWIEARITPSLNEKGEILRVDGVIRDITDRRQAEQALQDSERKFRALIEKSKDGIALTDRDRIIRYVSPAIQSILGYEPSDIIGKETAMFRFPDESGNMNSEKWILPPGTSVTKILRASHKEGSHRWVEVTATNQQDNPAVNAIVTNFRDVTEQKLAQELVQNSEKRFRALIENNKEGIALSDEQRRFIYLSPSVRDILGFTPEEMIGATAQDLYHADDREKIRSLVQHIMSRQQLYGSTQIRIMHKDGRYRWIELVLSNQFDDPAVQAMVTNFRDITSSKEAAEALMHSEQRFKYLIEKNQDVIAMTGGDGSISYMSPAVKEVLGYQPEELLGTSAMELMHPDELPDNIGHLAWCNENPGKAMFMVLRLRHKDASWRWMEASSISHLDSPAVNAIVSNLRDITDRKKIQDELFELNRSLEQKVKERTEEWQEANRALESFSAMAAHDLQSPLRVLTGYVSLLKIEYEHMLPPDGITLMEVIIKQASRMKNLVSDLLSFSHASHTSLNRTPVEMTHMVREITDELLLARQGRSIPAIVLHDLGISDCDAGLIREVWANLISNAIKYSTGTEQPKIEIGVRQMDEEAVFFIADNGVGFDMQAADKMFQIFQRMHSNSDFEGTGIGLALVKSIINKHGGRIWAESVQGAGATFYFTLPEASLDHA